MRLASMALPKIYHEIYHDSPADYHSLPALTRTQKLWGGLLALFSQRAHAHHLDLQGRACRTRYSLTGKREDIDEAVEYFQTSLDIGHPSHTGRRHARLSNLGLSLIDRYRHFSTDDDVEKAIAAFQEAKDLTPHGHRMQALVLSNLSSGYLALASRDTHEADYDRSIDLAQQALDAVTADHDQYPAPYRNNLAVLLGARYAVYGNDTDLSKSIYLSAHALEEAEDDPRNYLTCQINLSLGFLMRFERHGNEEDLAATIALAHDALDGSDAEDPDRGVYLGQLCKALVTRHLIVGRDLHKQMSDLNEAIQAGEEAIQIIPLFDTERAHTLVCISTALRSRYKVQAQLDQTNLKMEDLDMAIQYAREAVNATDIQNADRSKQGFNLAECLVQKAERTRSPAILREAVHYYLEACNVRAEDPRWRLQVSRAAARCLIKLQDWHMLDKTLQQAVFQDLSRIGPRSLTRDDQQSVIKIFSGLSSLAASAALQNGADAITALKLLETGRGIIADILMNSRSDISALPEPFRSRYKELQGALSSPIPNVSPLSQPFYAGTNDLTAQRLKVSHELENLETTIRALPGHQNFHLPLGLDEIKDLAGNDMIVSINVSELRADAFVVLDGTIYVVPLPALNLDDAEKNAHTMSQITNPSSRHMKPPKEHGKNAASTARQYNEDLKEICSWLWHVAVFPILQHLNLLDPHLRQRKHICWVNSGYMGVMPLHAAGNHHDESTDNTISHATSSYASSIRVLSYSAKAAGGISASHTDIVVVAMPSTPGGRHTNLNVKEEVTTIVEHSHKQAQVLQCSEKRDIVAALRDCNVVHFACHGFADPGDPSDSGLLVGNTDLETLTVRELADLKRHPGSLAYLSACSTAELAAHDLRDENIHLASAFQMVGFRHIVGTLWSANDAAAVAVAKKFYAILLNKERSDRKGFSRHSIASALNNALLEIRDFHGHDSILFWGPFIHMGW